MRKKCLLLILTLLALSIPLSPNKLAFADTIKLYIAEKKPNRELRNLFNETHPNVEFIDVNVDWAVEDPIKRIRGLDELDILEITNEEGISKLIQNAFIEPLILQDIVAAHQMYFPQVKEFLMYEGMVMGIPIKLEVRPWLINRTLWGELQLPPSPVTFDDYIELVNIWKKDYSSLYADYVIAGDPGWGGTKMTLVLNLLDQFVYEQQLSNAILTFDNENLKTLLSHVLTVEELTYPDQFTGPLIQGRFDSNFLSIDIVDFQNLEGGEWAPIIPPIVIAGSASKIGGELTSLCLLQQSKNKEIAMEYLSFVSDHKDQYQLGLSQMLILQEYSISNVNDFSSDTIKAWNEFSPFITFYTDALGGHTYSREFEGATVLVQDLLFPWTDESGVEHEPSDLDSFLQSLSYKSNKHYGEKHLP